MEAMKIRPFNFTCARDWESSELLVRSWMRFRPDQPWTIYFDPQQPITDRMREFCSKYGVTLKRQSRKNFGQWCWDSSMCKLDGWRDMAADTPDDDTILLYSDSDAMFHNGYIDGFIQGEFCGFPNDVKIIVNGQPWSHFSGCLMAATARAAKNIGSITEERLQFYRQLMQSQGDQASGGICQNEDVVISFLMHMRGVAQAPFPASVGEGDPEAVILGKRRNWRPYSHLSGIFDRPFCGVHTKNKWDIPRSIALAGVVI